MLQFDSRMGISENRMEMKQQLEWNEAQKTLITVDLVAAAKEQLKFLATVDRNRWLYEGRGLDKAIHRYYSCWLPLLAKHSESPYFDGPLVVPLDCEWIWHCHRLNPVRYKTDCEKLYGRILDNHDVESSVNAKSKQDTEELWKHLYTNEPYDLDSARALSEDVHAKAIQAEKYSDYDLVSAVTRQSPFFYQVSRPHINNDLYLEGAVARYKGFLHLIRRNKERSMKSFTVPTYDIDLIWHTHQLHPASYCKDLVDIMGKVLEHDDTDSDRTKGKKLDTGFSRTTKQWEETYGLRYWRAGAMYRGSSPSPLGNSYYPSNPVRKNADIFHEHQKIMQYPEMAAVEVMLELVDIRNLPEGHKGSFFVSFSKTQPDRIFNAKRKLTILSVTGEKQVAYFQCEPNGHLLFDLMSCSSSGLPIPKSVKSVGSVKVSLEDLVCPTSKLTMEKWLEVVPSSKMETLKPICLRVAISVTTPTSAPYVFHFVRPRAFSKNSCLFPLPGRIQHAKNWTHVIDDAGDEVTSLQMRDSKKSKGETDSTLHKEVVGISKSSEVHSLAELVGKEWLLLDAQWSLQLQTSSSDDGHLFELAGQRNVKFFPGQRLDYEHKHCTKQRSQEDFMTAVEFSAQDPYGKAVALVDLKFGVINVKEEWFLLPGSITAFVLCDMLKKEGSSSLVGSAKHSKEKNFSTQETDVCHEEDNRANLESETEKGVKLDLEATKGNIVAPANEAISGGCGDLMKRGACGSCGAVCGNKLKSGGCGCGSMLESGGCGGCGGSGCGGWCGGGGCGSMLESGGCGGCGGGGCGNRLESGGCGGCGGGGCGNRLESGGCGGCGGGGCGGNSLKSSGCGGCGGGGCGNGLASITTVEVNA
ncbi:glycine-rich domain-containing protein 2-like isoform X1 [Solanum verrucosum]|uniref:glycine-rich domain-containing protein 2-like isoform X1 n=2 Tax=Solanum verrucosum TaxID=315347 RepID=UPI0020D0772F|nr:glycine-rich domain-containing protein 2-like isoform X1 [Solanum verrucosum]